MTCFNEMFCTISRGKKQGRENAGGQDLANTRNKNRRGRHPKNLDLDALVNGKVEVSGKVEEETEEVEEVAEEGEGHSRTKREIEVELVEDLDEEVVDDEGLEEEDESTTEVFAIKSS